MRRTPEWVVVAVLVAVTAIWGSTFVVVKQAVDTIPVTDFLAWRFAIATAVMVALRPRAVARLGPVGRGRGVLLGLALGGGYVLQTLGLVEVSASVSGFITGLFVVLTPLCAGLVLRERVTPAAWFAVLLATAGLALLALRGFAAGYGELLTLGCAVAFAVHIVGLGQWSHRHDSYGLAVVQLAVVAAGCALLALPGGLPVPRSYVVWRALVITAVFATAVAYVAQTWAQARLPATRAAVIMTMEPVFAGLFGVALAGDRLGVRQLAGAALIVAAMLLVEVGPRRGAEGDVERLEV